MYKNSIQNKLQSFKYNKYYNTVHDTLKNAMYKIEWNDCNRCYVDQTKNIRTLKYRHI